MLELILQIIAVYCLAGFLFAFYFAWFAVAKIDPNAKKATFGFRVLIVPGTMLFWPMFALRLAKGQRTPPAEQNAHDQA